MFPDLYKERYQAIQALESIMNDIEEGGCLIMATCFSANLDANATKSLGTHMVEIGRGRVDVLLNRGYTINPIGEDGDYQGNYQYLNIPLTKDKVQEGMPSFYGWLLYKRESGQPEYHFNEDVQLNSNKIPSYEINKKE
ncbi:MAG: hypothetical protein R3C61_20345 [Bacteroidia bacterium]